MPLVVGLTGGIGSGKSTVASLFSELGVPVFDADRFARDVVQSGSVALGEIAEHFGPDVITANGELDRAKLRTIVFGNPHRRAELEALLHPRIRARIQASIAEVTARYCVVCIPLLVECQWTDLVDRVLVVDLPEALQRERAMQRGGLTGPEVEAIMNTQASRAARLRHATEVISNDRDLHHLRSQVAALHQVYSGNSSPNGTSAQNRQ